MLKPSPPWMVAACSDGGPPTDAACARVSHAPPRRACQKTAHPHVGVDTLFEPAAVGRAAFRLDFDPQIAFVRQANLHGGGLGHDGGVGADMLIKSAVPRLPYSSSATAAITRSPRSFAPASISALAAAICAASDPFMS